MGREKTVVAPNSFVLAGNLANELTEHAYERCRYFFTFVFAARVIADYLKIDPNEIVSHKATHQIDTGFRSTAAVYADFDVTDPKVVDHPCSSFRTTDAAHFCNLGIQSEAQLKIATAANAHPGVSHFYEILKAFSAATRRLPQRVNIGPDRIIDEFHATYALTVLGSTQPLISRANIGRYLAGATGALRLYRAKQIKEGLAGVAACVDSYLHCYARDEERLWSQLWMATDLECRVTAYQLDPKRHVSML